MALKPTVFKATLNIADIDRGVYVEHALTLARHPSETDERMMVRLLAFACHNKKPQTNLRQHRGCGSLIKTPNLTWLKPSDSKSPCGNRHRNAG